MKKTKKAPKSAKTKKPKPAAGKSRAVKASTLTISVQGDCSLVNNQGLNPPHLSRSTTGGFAHQVVFAAQTETWICLPKTYFSNAPNGPVHLYAGQHSNAYVIKTNANLGAMGYSHSCDGPCPDDRANGDSIIIDT